MGPATASLPGVATQEPVSGLQLLRDPGVNAALE